MWCSQNCRKSGIPALDVPLKFAPKVRHDPSRRSLGPVHIAGADQRWKRSEARVAQAMEIGLPASLVTSSEMDDVKF